MLDAKRFGLAMGILWGVSMFLLTWANIWLGYGTQFMSLMGDVYPGFEVSPLGSIIGLVYGFADGAIGFFLVAWLYNKIKV